MATVPLDFIPPTTPGLVALHIYEAPLATGPFTEIERATAIGTYPDYITRYETTLATNPTDWFSIAWEDAGGAIGPTSAALQGGTQTLLSEIVDRVMLRDSSLNEAIVAQEAQAVIEQVLSIDATSVTPSAITQSQLSGVTLLTLARALIQKVALSSSSGTAQSWTAGIVSMNSGTTSQQKSPTANVDALIAQANKDLGTSYSIILLMEEMAVAGGAAMKLPVVEDVSRTMIELG